MPHDLCGRHGASRFFQNPPDVHSGCHHLGAGKCPALSHVDHDRHGPGRFGPWTGHGHLYSHSRLRNGVGSCHDGSYSQLDQLSSYVPLSRSRRRHQFLIFPIFCQEKRRGFVCQSMNTAVRIVERSPSFS